MLRHRQQPVAACGLALILALASVATASTQETAQRPAAILSIAAEGQYRFGETSVTREELPQRIAGALDDLPLRRLQVLGLNVAPTVSYGTVVDVLAFCRQIGHDRVQFFFGGDADSGSVAVEQAWIAGAVTGVTPRISGLPPLVRPQAIESGPPPPPTHQSDPPFPYPGQNVSHPDALFVTLTGTASAMKVAVNRREFPFDEMVLVLRYALEDRRGGLRYVCLKASTALAFDDVLNAMLTIEAAGAAGVVFVIDDVDGPDGIPSLSSTPDAVQRAPGFIRLTGGVLAGKAITKPQPVHSAMAGAAQIEGPVVVEVEVNEEGHVIRARAVSGHPLLWDAAVEAAKGWVFKPTQLYGKPVKIVGTITFNFRRE